VLDEERCFRAVQSRDTRFDGWFYTAVVTTGIYCRPSCPATPPKRANVRFFPSAAAAHGAGFRACKRCRPDAAPGSPEWNTRVDVVARAMRLIADGTVDREGVGGLARRLGYSDRHLHRLLVAEVGAGALALARAQRAQTARVLLETTDLSAADVAFAAGFASVRQFNDTVSAVFAMAPTALRHAARPAPRATAPRGTITVRLPFRPPLAVAHLFSFLAVRAVPGVEAGDARSYRRTLSLPHGTGTVALEAVADHVRCTLNLDDVRDVATAVARARRLLDLDADPRAVDDQLGADPLLAPLVAARPGLRMAGSMDGTEAAVRAVLGQQVSVAAARAAAGTIARRHGERVGGAGDGLHLRFPSAAALAAADPATLPVPTARAETVVRLARAVAEGDIVFDTGVDRDELSARLLQLLGIGPWTVAYIAMRAVGDPDAFLATDLGVRRALARLGARGDGAAAAEVARRWRPWRSYALHHLWASLPARPSTGKEPSP
jgi:AraC family transcriptional regulator of adaptative response / DNA-3-methyladenine glycosylase II